MAKDVMPVAEVIRGLKKSNRKQVERDTGVNYRYLRHLISGSIKNPGTRQMDALRAYFSKQT